MTPWALWLACASPPPNVSQPGPPDGPTLPWWSPPDGATPLLTFEAGYTLYTLSFGDVNGDGAVDASVVVQGEVDDSSGIVFGPLVGQALPGDFSVLLSRDLPSWTYPSGAYSFGELTGAPPVDVVYRDPSLADYVIPGPWDGSTVPDASWIPISASWRDLADIDHDGVLDKVAVVQGPEALQVTFGPADRFAGPPDVTIDLCRTIDSGDWFHAIDNLNPAGDLDGDGAPELSVGAYRDYTDGGDCGGFTVSVPPSGAVDPFGGADGARDFAISAVPLGDWNGDGLPELLSTGYSPPGAPCGVVQSPLTSGAPCGVLQSPLTFDPYDPDLGAAQVLAFPAPIWGAEALPFDRNGDGRPELLGFTVDARFAVIDSTLAALAAEPELWPTGRPEEAFVDQGRAVLVFHTEDGVWGLDVGAAEAL